MTLTTADKLKVVERELALRKRTYARWVSNGTMALKDARYEIEAMTEIVADYRKALAEDDGGALL